MAVNSKHPSYAGNLQRWLLMRHAYEGEDAVKAAGAVYLPPSPGHVADGWGKGADKPGQLAYEAYKARAVFPDYVTDAVERYVGMMHSKEATIELPSALEPLRDKATLEGESLLALLRRINEQQLAPGRLGLLLDFPTAPVGTQPMPYIAMYYAEACLNWDSSADHEGVNALRMVVLDESGPQMDPATMEWVDKQRYRVLRLLSPQDLQPGASQQNEEGNGTDGPSDVVINRTDATEVPPDSVEYRVAVVDGTTPPAPSEMVAPLYRGQPLREVPFVFVNSRDILPEPDKPPLLGLGYVCMAIYRGEADYRHTLFMQGQDTLVTIGTVRQDGQQVNADEPLRVGAGAHIGLDMDGDAKYIGIGADGIEGQREALRDDRKLAESKAGTMISPGAGKQESGDALTTRVAAQTASLTQIAKAGALALENMLKIAARWMGANPDEVVVTPNLEFETTLVTAQEITQLMAARTMGAPISLKSIHGVMVDRGLTGMEYEAELDLIAEEDLDRAKRVATLPQPPAPPAAPKPGGTPSPAPGPGGARRPA